MTHPAPGNRRFARPGPRHDRPVTASHRGDRTPIGQGSARGPNPPYRSPAPEFERMASRLRKDYGGLSGSREVASSLKEARSGDGFPVAEQPDAERRPRADDG